MLKLKESGSQHKPTIQKLLLVLQHQQVQNSEELSKAASYYDRPWCPSQWLQWQMQFDISTTT